jgi:DNA helicase-2/ATP-dependent DNA helicase PcrA
MNRGPISPFVALRWWLGDGSPSGRSSAYRRLRMHCEQSGQSPWQALTALEEGNLQLQNVGSLLTKFQQLKEALAAVDGKTVTEVIDTLMPDGVEGCEALREAALLAAPNIDDVSDLFEFLRVGCQRKANLSE